MGFWDFNFVVAGFAVFFVIDLIMNAAAGFSANLSNLFLFVAMWQLRTKLRERHNIPGSCGEDFCTAFWCGPCTVTQLLGQMWVKPEVQPGCQFDEAVAMRV